MNFNLLKVKDLKCIINQDLASDQAQLLERLLEDIEEQDPDEYLLPLTFAWCHQQLIEIGHELVGIPFNPKDLDQRFLGDTKSLYEAVYMKLRDRAYEYWASG